MLKHLDLCSGIGGFALGLQSTDFFKTIGFCEIDPYCQKVLKKNFPSVPIFNDIKELKPKELNLQPDIITAGFPCQPFSVAGKQKGKDDDRNLWQETFRIIKESRPTFFIGENVGGIVKLYLDTILKDLESEGYSTRCFNISASSIGAKHRRERIWIVSYSNAGLGIGKNEEIQTRGNATTNGSQNVSNSNSRMRGGRRAIGESGIDQERELFTTQEKSGCQTQNLWSKTIGCDVVSREEETLSDTLCEGLQGHKNFSITHEEKIGHFANSSIKRKSNVSNTNVIGLEEHGHSETKESIKRSEKDADVWNTESTRLESSTKGQREEQLGRASTWDEQCQENWWQIESEFCGVPDGVSYKLDKDRANRIKGLGNAIVPQIPYYIGLAIKEMYE